MLDSSNAQSPKAVERLAHIMGHDHPADDAEMADLINQAMSEITMARQAIGEAMHMGNAILAQLILERDPRVGYLASYLAGNHHPWRNGSPPSTDFYLTWRSPITANHAGHAVRFYNEALAIWKYHPLSDPIEGNKLPMLWQPLPQLPERVPT